MNLGAFAISASILIATSAYLWNERIEFQSDPGAGIYVFDRWNGTALACAPQGCISVYPPSSQQ